MTRRRRRPHLTAMSDEEMLALQDDWERRLRDEGLPASMPQRYMRQPQAGADGKRAWQGPREVPAVATDERLQDRGNMPRPSCEAEALMVAPHTEVDAYPADKLLELRHALLNAIEDALDPRDADLVISAVLGDETYEELGARLGLPKSTAWYAVGRAVRRLRTALTDVPEIQAYLDRHHQEPT